MAKVGRKETYNPDFHPQNFIQRSSFGKNLKQIACEWGVYRQTLYDWAQRHPEFDDALKKGRDLCEAWYTNLGQSAMTGTARTPDGQPIKVDLGWFVWMTKNVCKWSDKYAKQDDELNDILRMGDMTREELLDLIAAKKSGKLFQKEEDVSFEKFCENAGYPRPYPKQIEMMEFGMNETVPRLLLGSRGYGKTDYVVILGVANKLKIDPTYTVLIVTKSQGRNAAMLEEISKAAKANGLKFEKENSTCLRLEKLLGKGHSVTALTVGSKSFRGHHPDLIVMDDTVTEDDVSEATRKKVQRVYNELYKLSENILIIGQPVHKFDLYQTLRPLLKKMEVPHGSIPELDVDLEAQRLAGVSEESIQASYFLKIVSDSATPFDKVKYMPSFPSGDAVAFIDPSFEGGDYTAISIVRGHFDGIAVQGHVFKKAWYHCIDDLAKRMNELNVRKLCFETNSLGEQPLTMLRQALPNIGVCGKKSTQNKHSRIMAAGGYAHLIHLSKKSDKTYIDQVVQYEYGAKHDDAPDSLASCMEWIGLIRGKQKA